ncbi:MAG: hypothetical protein DDT29_01843 [Dehalococcoidia bacterium]|nr:hypothetical protein [Bacillota bacterium]
MRNTYIYTAMPSTGSSAKRIDTEAKARSDPSGTKLRYRPSHLPRTAKSSPRLPRAALCCLHLPNNSFNLAGFPLHLTNDVFHFFMLCIKRYLQLLLLSLFFLQIADFCNTLLTHNLQFLTLLLQSSFYSRNPFPLRLKFS